MTTPSPIPYAILSSEGRCINRTLWDGVSDWQPPSGCTAVPDPDGLIPIEPDPEVMASIPPDWPRFKVYVLTNSDINAALATALTTVPAAATALAPTLLRAEQGDVTDFAAAWAAVMQAAPLAPEVLTELVSLAQECELPEVFVAALSNTLGVSTPL